MWWVDAAQQYEKVVKCLGDSVLSLMGVRLYAQIAECYQNEALESKQQERRLRYETLSSEYTRMAMELLRIRCGADEKLCEKMYAYICCFL